MNLFKHKTQKFYAILLFVLMTQTLGSLSVGKLATSRNISENTGTQINPAQSSNFDYTLYPEFFDGSAHDFCFAGDIAFLVDGMGGIEIFNVSDLQTFNKIGEWDEGYDIQEAVIIDDILAVVIGYQAIVLLNISDVTNFVEIGRYESEDYIFELKSSNDYIFFENGYYSSLGILNITNPTNPQLINDTFDLWSSIEFRKFEITGDQLYLTTYYDPCFQIYDIADLYHPQLLYNYTLSDEDYVYLRHFVVLNDGVLLQCNEEPPLFFNTTDLNEINIIVQNTIDSSISRIATDGELIVCIGYSGITGYIGIYDLPNDLIFREILGSEFEGDYPYKMILHDLKIFFLHLDDGFSIYDVSNLEDFQNVVTFDEDAYFYKTITDGDYIFALTNFGLEIFDFSNPQTPEKIGEYRFFAGYSQFFKKNNYIYAYEGGSGLIILDVSLPSKPTELDQVSITGYSVRFEMNDQNIFVFYRDPNDFEVRKLIIYEIQEDGLLEEVFDEQIWYDIRSSCICEDQIYYITQDQELWKIDVGNLKKIKNISLNTFGSDYYAQEIQAVPNHETIYVGLNNDEIHFYSNRQSNTLLKVDELILDYYSSFLAYNLYVFVSTEEGLEIYDTLSEDRFILLTKIPGFVYNIQHMAISTRGGLVLSKYSDGIQWISLPDMEIAPEATSRSILNFNIPGYTTYLLGIVSVITLFGILKQHRWRKN